MSETCQKTVARFSPLRRTVTLVLAATLVLSISGCNYFILLSYLIGGPPSIEPDFERQAEGRRSFTDEGVTVAVLCDAPTDVLWSNPDIHHLIAKTVGYRLHQNKITVINPDSVRAWLDENPEWDRPDELGAAFDCTYVVWLDLHNFTIYERDSSNLYRGRCEVSISVYEMGADGTGEKIYANNLTSKFPLRAPRSTSEISSESFRHEYMIRLSEEIGRMFYPWYNGDDIPDAI